MEPRQSWTLLGNYPLRHYSFENGLNAYLLHNPISPVAAFLTHYTVGSASEEDSERGLAHFFEHMMFRETDSLGDGDFDRIIAQSGGVGLNAFTSYDTTAFHVSLPSKNLERVIGLESDRMANLKLSEALIEIERGAVLGEMNMYKDMPSEQMWETLTAEAFSPHPYRHPVIGYEEQVRNFAQRDFERFYRAHYAPNRAVVVVAGDFDEARLVEQLAQAYGHLSPGAPRPEPSPAAPPWSESRRVEIFHARISTENLMMGWRTPGLTHGDLPALTVLAAVLSAGQSSPLHRKIVLDGLGSQASAFVMEAEMMLLSPGMFMVDVGLLHGIAAERAESAVRDLLESLARDGLAEEDLARAKNLLRLGFHSSLATNMSLARHVGGYVVACGDPQFGEKSLAKIAAVGQDAVMAALESYISAAPCLTLIQRPESGGRP